jgi:Tol biopolymer transport system component
MPARVVHAVFGATRVHVEGSQTMRWVGIRSRAAGVAAVAGVVALAGPTGPAQAAFPGVNGRIVFLSERDGNAEIYAMNADGSGQTNLTNSAAIDTQPAVSPTGEQIAFTRNGDIYVMNADGSSPTNLTNNAAGDFAATWSPDGQQIAFFSTRDGDSEIYVMNADGSGQTNITNNDGGGTPNRAIDVQPAWSPDGSRIAFVSQRANGIAEIYVMDPDGSNVTRLTDNSDLDVLPSWSPDGSRIAFASTRDGNEEVYVMNADGTGQTNLTDDAADDTDPAWSPDGQKIVFATDRDGDVELYAMNADGTGAVNLTNVAGRDDHPDWGVEVDEPPPGPEDVEDAVEGLPDDALGARGHRSAILAKIDAAEAAIAQGKFDTARTILEQLRDHLDGCETSGEPDRNDWIVDCDAQDEVRDLLDGWLATLP